jgi:hypothetical protein
MAFMGELLAILWRLWENFWPSYGVNGRISGHLVAFMGEFLAINLGTLTNQ